MSKISVDEIRKRFELSKEFNEIFDAFEQCVEQRLNDIELYRLLFWNPTLTPDERCLFGEKLAKEFPPLAFDTYMWLANIFEVTHSMIDNYDLAVEYYKKAASVKREAISPYLQAADCYESDLNIPPVLILIEFLKKGVNHVKQPGALYERLVRMYEIAGNDEMSEFYRRKLREDLPPPAGPSPSE